MLFCGTVAQVWVPEVAINMGNSRGLGELLTMYLRFQDLSWLWEFGWLEDLKIYAASASLEDSHGHLVHDCMTIKSE